MWVLQSSLITIHSLDFSYFRREIRSVFAFVESVLFVSVWV